MYIMMFSGAKVGAFGLARKHIHAPKGRLSNY